jgi:hypothetical protein
LQDSIFIDASPGDFCLHVSAVVFSGVWPGFNIITRFKPTGIGTGFKGGIIPSGRVDKHIPQLLAVGPLVEFFMYEVKKIGEKYSKKNKKRDNQKGFDQSRHCGAEALAFDHPVNHGKNKHQHRRDKQNRMQGVNYAPLLVFNLPRHFNPPLAVLIKNLVSAV